MTEVEFLSQCHELGAQRGYAKGWAYIMFRERYGFEASREVKKEATARYVADILDISDELMDWLSDYWKAAFNAK